MALIQTTGVNAIVRQKGGTKTYSINLNSTTPRVQVYDAGDYIVEITYEASVGNADGEGEIDHTQVQLPMSVQLGVTGRSKVNIGFDGISLNYGDGANHVFINKDTAVFTYGTRGLRISSSEMALTLDGTTWHPVGISTINNKRVITLD